MSKVKFDSYDAYCIAVQSAVMAELEELALCLKDNISAHTFLHDRVRELDKQIVLLHQRLGSK